MVHGFFGVHSKINPLFWVHSKINPLFWVHSKINPLLSSYLHSTYPPMAAQVMSLLSDILTSIWVHPKIYLRNQFRGSERKAGMFFVLCHAVSDVDERKKIRRAVKHRRKNGGPFFFRWMHNVHCSYTYPVLHLRRVPTY